MSRITVAILGFGHLGQYIFQKLAGIQDVEILFIYNRSKDKLSTLVDAYTSIHQASGAYQEAIETAIHSTDMPDLFIEVSHPEIARHIIDHYSGRFFITSLTAFADQSWLDDLYRHRALKNAYYIPTGAGWGFHDIQWMGQTDLIERIDISMTFHIDALRLPTMQERHFNLSQRHTPWVETIATGDIPTLANIAPNNVNTMCGVALSAGMNGFQLCHGELKATNSSHRHIVEIIVQGHQGYKVKTQRINPASSGHVTGSMTYSSLWADLLTTLRKIGEDRGFVIL